MIYTVKYPNSSMHMDTDKIAARFMNCAPLYVRPSTPEERVSLVEYLESEGFTCQTNKAQSRQDILDSRFPLVIGLYGKTISCLGNVTCAAAAAGTGLVMGKREFYLLYSIKKCQR